MRKKIGRGGKEKFRKGKR
jgi:hypothetical protein